MNSYNIYQKDTFNIYLFILLPVYTLILQAPTEPVDQDQSAEEESTLTLEDLLSKVGLQEKITLFQEEQIDMESLVS